MEELEEEKIISHKLNKTKFLNSLSLALETNLNFISKDQIIEILRQIKINDEKYGLDIKLDIQDFIYSLDNKLVLVAEKEREKYYSFRNFENVLTYYEDYLNDSIPKEDKRNSDFFDKYENSYRNEERKISGYIETIISKSLNKMKPSYKRIKQLLRYRNSQISKEIDKETRKIQLINKKSNSPNMLLDIKILKKGDLKSKLMQELSDKKLRARMKSDPIKALTISVNEMSKILNGYTKEVEERLEDKKKETILKEKDKHNQVIKEKKKEIDKISRVFELIENIEKAKEKSKLEVKQK